MTQPKSIPDLMLAAQVAIDGTLADADLRAALAPFGYDEARLLAARALYEETDALVARQLVEYGEQHGATQRVEQARQVADIAYSRTLQVARVAFKGDPKADRALLLTGRRKPSLSGWLEQSGLFYDNLLGTPDLLAGMARFGFTQAKLQQEAALVEAVRVANAAQEREKGEAQHATQARDAKLDDLDEWLADFTTIAHVALADTPQWLEKLGLGPIP